MIELAPVLDKWYTYDTAWLYCATLTHNNKYDWRLPSLDEYNDYDEIDIDCFDVTDDELIKAGFKHKICPVRTVD